MSQLVITAIGRDRPGLVGQFTGHLHAAGANVADSRMVNLRGQFAMLLLVEGTDAALAALPAKLEAAAKSMGLTLHVSPQGAPAPRQAGVPFKLRTYAADQPGIVHRVTDVLSRHNANVENLETHLTSAPFDGTPLFTMEVELVVPPSVSVRALRRDLEAICDELNCDIDLDPA